MTSSRLKNLSHWELTIFYCFFQRMFMRDEETLLLLKSESMSMDSPRDEYTPLQYENSLGKLQAVTVKAPRKIIDMSSNVLNQDAEQLSTAQKVNIKDKNKKLTFVTCQERKTIQGRKESRGNNLREDTYYLGNMYFHFS